MLTSHLAQVNFGHQELTDAETQVCRGMEVSKLARGKVDLLRTILIHDHNCAATCGWDFIQEIYTTAYKNAT